MSTSLPKIKTIADNAESGSQKQLKFKKLKLTTDQSAGDIRERFKSVRTQRLSSLERYSTVEGQRQYKKQKIHLNLLERKLLSGTYDEARETGNDLNSLKQKTDYYKTQSLQKQTEIQRLKLIIEQLKIQSQNFESMKRKNEELVGKAKKKYQQQKLKTEGTIFDRQTLENMISQRKKINHFLEFQINENKAYLVKLKAVAKQVQTEARQSNETTKNLYVKTDKLNEEALREQRTREQMIYEKQTIINKRKEDQNTRLQKSKQFKKSLDVAEEEIEKKDFMDLYKGIVAHLFFQKYSKIKKQSLEEKYQIIQNMYDRIGSYQKFNKEQPTQMIERFQQLKPETQDYESKIKKLQKQQVQLEKKNKQILEKAKEVQILSNKNAEGQDGIPRNKSAYFEDEINQSKEKVYERKIQSTIEQTKKIQEIVFKIEKWAQRYAQQLEIKYRKGQNIEDLGKNMTNIFKITLKQKQNLEAAQKSSKVKTETV